MIRKSLRIVILEGNSGLEPPGIYFMVSLILKPKLDAHVESGSVTTTNTNITSSRHYPSKFVLSLF